MTNIRELLGVDTPYWTFNREERNYAALLYYALLSGDNLGRFLELINCDFPRQGEATAYVEYAYLRDAWHSMAADNVAKRSIITELLNTSDVRSLAGASVLEWNTHFGVNTPVASSGIVQSPSRRSIPKFDPHIADNDDFLATCRFKWGFNIKPDLVIHTDNDHAVVIEAKYASAEGSYPGSAIDRVVFKERGLASVGQTALQKYLFEELLGVRAQFLYIVNKPTAKSATHETRLWSEVFSSLDLDQIPVFVREWLRTLAT